MSSQTKRCRSCGRISVPRSGRIEECGFCNSRLLEPVDRITTIGASSAVNGSPSEPDLSMRSAATTSQTRKTCLLLYTSAAIQLISGLLFSVHDSSLEKVGLVAFAIGAVTGLIGGIKFLMSIYFAWKTLEAFSPLSLRQSGFGSPGLIVGLLFVPVFNLFWMFSAFGGWSRVARQILDQNLVSGPRPTGVHAFRFCMASLVSPVIASLVLAALGPEMGLLINWILAILMIRMTEQMLQEMDQVLSLLRTCRPLCRNESTEIFLNQSQHALSI